MLLKAKGNLIDMAEDGMFNVIVHGCNCLNTMGSGIAKEIKARCPSAWSADVDSRKTYPAPILKLGNFSVGMELGNGGFYEVINAYTQLEFYPRGVDHFEYDSFKLILRKLDSTRPNAKYGFPYIGMGLAGGNPDRIIKILEDFAAVVTNQGGSVTLVEYSNS